MAIGSLARGFKEAQNFLMPVYFLFFAPAHAGRAGRAAAVAGAWPLVPGLNVSLLARDIAAGQGRASARPRWCWARRLAGGWWRWPWRRALYVSERFLAVGDRSRRRRASAAAEARPARLTRPPSGEALALFAIGFLLLYFVFMPLQRLATWCAAC